MDLIETLFLSNVELVPEVSSLCRSDNENLILPSSQDFPFSILLKKCDKFYCPRCRFYHSLIEDHLCERCSLILGQAV